MTQGTTPHGRRVGGRHPGDGRRRGESPHRTARPSTTRHPVPSRPVGPAPTTVGHRVPPPTCATTTGAGCPRRPGRPVSAGTRVADGLSRGAVCSPSSIGLDPGRPGPIRPSHRATTASRWAGRASP